MIRWNYNITLLKPKETSSGRQTPSKYSSAIDEYNIAKETIARGVWRWITRDYENPDRGHSNINNVGAHGVYGVPGILTHLSIKGVSVDLTKSTFLL